MPRSQYFICADQACWEPHGPWHRPLRGPSRLSRVAMLAVSELRALGEARPVSLSLQIVWSWEVFQGSASQEAGNKRRSELINGTQDVCLGEESKCGGWARRCIFPGGIPAEKPPRGRKVCRQQKGNKWRETGTRLPKDQHFPEQGNLTLSATTAALSLGSHSFLSNRQCYFM